MYSLINGRDAALPKWLGVAWCAGAGYLLGTTSLAQILETEHFTPNGPLGLLAVGLAPGGLSALAAYLGTRGRSVLTTALLTMVGALVASLACAPSTWVLLALTGGETHVGHVGSGGDAAGELALVTAFGAFLAAPLGILYGLVYTPALVLLRGLRARPSRSALDLMLLLYGLGWALLASVCLHLLRELPVGPGSWSEVEPESLVWACTVALALGLAAALFGAARASGRRLFVARVRRGRHAGWEIVDLDDVPDDDQLPELFTLARQRRVLARREDRDQGPFRSGSMVTPIVRV